MLGITQQRGRSCDRVRRNPPLLPRMDRRCSLRSMQGHLPMPPQPHVPIGLSPVIGYIARREPQPLEERLPVEREWWELDDDDEPWPARRPRVIKVTAVVVSISLLMAGAGTVLEVVLSAH
jgi:hypothetical protein